MSTTKTKSPKRKSKGLAPLPEWRKPKAAKPAKPKAVKKPKAEKKPAKAKATKKPKSKAIVISQEGEQSVIGEFKPDTRPVQEIVAEKVTFNGGGILHFKEDLEPSEAISLVSFYHTASECSGISIGCILNNVAQGPHGSRYDAIEQATGLDRKTLRNYKSVIGKVGMNLIEYGANRAKDAAKEPPSYSHLARIASLPADKQEKLVDRIVDDELTVVQVAEEVRRISGKKKTTKKKAEPSVFDQFQAALGHAREIQAFLCSTNYDKLEEIQRVDFREAIRPIAREFTNLENL